MNTSTSKSSSGLIEKTGFLFFPIALLGRLPFAMTVVGVLTLVVTVRESYTLGGITSAVVGLGTATVGPLLGYAADRFGQRPVLLLAALLNSISLVLLVAISYSELADWYLFIAAFAIGATAPQLSPMSRARLVQIINQSFSGAEHKKIFNSTMSYESMADELVFVFGPVIVGLLASLVGPWSPVVGAAILSLVFVGTFALHHTAKLAHTPKTAQVNSPISEVFKPRILILVAGMLFIGGFFGSSLTSLTGFMGVFADSSQAGLIYGIMGITSAALALSVSFFPETFKLEQRWLIFAAVVAFGSVLLIWADSVFAVAIILAICGIGIGPALVTLYSLGGIRGPEGRSNTVMSLLSSGIVVGQAAASAITGILLDNYGYLSAFYLVIVTAFGILIAGTLNLFLSKKASSEPKL